VRFDWNDDFKAIGPNSGAAAGGQKRDLGRQNDDDFAGRGMVGPRKSLRLASLGERLPQLGEISLNVRVFFIVAVVVPEERPFFRC